MNGLERQHSEDSIRPDPRDDQNHGMSQGFRAAYYNIPSKNQPERPTDTRDGSEGQADGEVWKDVDQQDVKLNWKQSAADAIKCGGVRPTRTGKECQRLNDVGESLLKKLNTSDSLPFRPERGDPVFDCLRIRMDTIHQAFATQYDKANHNWSEASWTKRHFSGDRKKQKEDQRERIAASPKLKFSMTRLGEVNRDLQALQQVKALQQSWEQRHSNLVDDVISDYHASLAKDVDLTSAARHHDDNFETSCYEVLKLSLDGDNLSHIPEKKIIFGKSASEQTNEAIDTFNKLKNRIRITIEQNLLKHQGFQTLLPWQRNGIMKRVAFLVQEFENTVGKENPKELQKINQELKEVSDLVKMVNLAKFSDDTHGCSFEMLVLWDRITKSRKQNDFGGHSDALQLKLNECVDSAIEASIARNDGSYLTERGKKTNEEAWETFKKVSKWLANKEGSLLPPELSQDESGIIRKPRGKR